METPLSTLFTTLAQVTFTVAGLMAIAIAGDSKRRDYWFSHEARSLFVYQSFLFLLLPGFVSLGGLIPSSPDNDSSSWIFSSLIFGFLYALLSLEFFKRKRKLKEPKEFNKLVTKISNVSRDMFTYGITLFFLSIIGIGAFYAESIKNQFQMGIFLGVVLILAIFSSTVNSVILLRANDDSLTRVLTPKLIAPRSEAKITAEIRQNQILTLTLFFLF